MQFLDFEKPIQDLYEELDRIREVSKKSKVDLSASIADIEKKIEESKKSLYKNLSGWQRVQLSRHPERPYTLEYIERISEGFVELFGDRNVKDDKAMVGGFGQIQGQTVMFIGHQKGNTTKQRQYRNFGMANPEGYRKALRLMKMAEKFNKPIVCLIDTPGAFPGIEGEERGQAEAIARNIQDMFLLTVPVVCVIIGEGASGGAIGIGVGDRVFMMENTWYSVISPESCSSILWRSWEHKERAAEALKLTAKDMLGNGLIDGIIKEPLGGAHVNPEEAAKNLQKKIVESLKELIPMDAEERIQERMAKFVKMGVFNEA
jgi:acetyl-CoA carboxylase carboxyl transferase subunit alpha